MTATPADPGGAIAVIIPCFNLGRTVIEAVDSACAQTRPPAEIIVVDDGSTDLHTQQVMASLHRPGLRIVMAPHGGAGRARNHGAAISTAPYLLFLDADDALEPAYLEIAGAILDTSPELDFVSTAMRAFGEAAYLWTPPPPELSAALTRGTIPITALCRRRVWQTVGGFDETLPASMDLDFWISALEAGFHGCVVPEPLLLRRVRSESLHHGAVTRGAYTEVLKTILEKHRAAIERIGPSLLIEKDMFLEQQRSDRLRLSARSEALHTELRMLDEEIGRVRSRLRERGAAVVDLSDYPALQPVSPVWGADRGRPVDRYYIERFLSDSHEDIRGRVLEIKDSAYARMFAVAPITACEVLDVVPDNPEATIVADLTCADDVPTASFDCFILTQTLHIIYDVRAALDHAHRVLKPGGVLLATLPAVSRINYENGGLDGGDYWRFTGANLHRLFENAFPGGHVDIRPAGNLRACIAFLYGLTTDDLLESELEAVDTARPLLFCVRAVKADSPAARPAPVVRASAEPAGAILMYHRVGDCQPDPHELCVSRAHFRAHMEHLARNYTVLSLEEVARAVESRRLPDRTIAITFDDGTIDALEEASPVLLEFDLPATFFVLSGCLAEEAEAWWDVLGRILLALETLPPTLPITLAGDQHMFRLEDERARTNAYRIIHQVLMNARLSERQAVIQHVMDWCGTPLPARHSHRLMVRDEVRRLAGRSRQTIGSHTVNHLFLPLQTPEDQWREVTASRNDLEASLQRPVTLFSYPYGAHDPNLADVVRRAGYTAGVTTHQQAFSAGHDVFALPRIDVRSTDGEVFGRVLDDLMRARPAVARGVRR